MAQIASLEPTQWSALKQIDKIEPLNESDLAVLDAIKQVLIEHHRLDRFGVCLLHKHFDIAADEVVIEQTDEATRVSTARVMRKADVNVESIETMWRFAVGDQQSAVCMARCVPEQGH